MKKFIAILMVLMLAVSMSAAFAEADVPDATQELTFFLNDSFYSLDTSDAKTTAEFQILSQCNESLLRLFTDENGNDYYEPAGCTSYDVSDDGLVWTFHLREMVWSDGVAVTAQQYVDSILRLLDPELAYTYAFYGWDIAGGEAYNLGEGAKEDVGLKAIDDLTLEITLAKATPYFEKKLAFVNMGPFRMDLFEANPDTWSMDPTVQAYCGPFILTEWVSGNSWTLEKNPTYWDAENVKLETVHALVVPEYSTMAQMFNAQQADMIDAYQDYTAQMISRADAGEFVYYKSTYPALWWINFNQATGGLSGLMQNAKVRRAISMSINRDEFVEVVFGCNTAAYSLIPYGMHTGTINFRETNVEPLAEESRSFTNEQLQELFKEGMAELGDTRDLSEITLTMINTGTTATDKASQEYWQQSIENKLGVKVDMQVFGDNALYRDARNNQQYDLSSGGMWHADFDDPVSFIDLWVSSSSWGKMFGQYASEKYDALFESLDTATTDEERNAIYAEMEKVLVYDEAGMCPVYFEDGQRFIQNYVKNLSMPQYGAVYEFSRAYISGK